MSGSLDAAAVESIDASGIAGDMLAIPDHITDALWRAESAFLEPASARSLVVCGMGGSAIGADLAAAIIGGSASGPISTCRGYELPGYVGPEDAVILSSYSGSTEETLSCFEQARDSGARLYVVSSGGQLSEAAHADGIPVIGLPGIFQPRAAVAYGVVAVIEIAIISGLAPKQLRADLAAAAEALVPLIAEWAPRAPEGCMPKKLARAALGRLPVIYGAGLTAPVAYRWRCQINENAKYPAWSAELPEAGHNEICSWTSSGEVAEVAAWFLADADNRPRIAERMEVSAQIAGAHHAHVETIDLPGPSRAHRLFSSVLLGDLTSLYLAVLRGVDPTPIPLIEELKERLGRPAGTA